MQTGMYCFCQLGREKAHPDDEEEGKWGQSAASYCTSEIMSVYGKLHPKETTQGRRSHTPDKQCSVLQCFEQVKTGRKTRGKDRM